jgi:hypothetical protein
MRSRPIAFSVCMMLIIGALTPMTIIVVEAEPANPPVILNIYDVNDLQNMNTNLGGTYVLMNDIDATITSTWNAGAGFIPIGRAGTPFTGSLTGNNFTITNLFINNASMNNVG